MNCHLNRMDVAEFILKMKSVYFALIDFIEETDDSRTKFQSLIELLEIQEISKNINEVQILFQLISRISDNHHLDPDFFNKLEQIYQYLIKDTMPPISYIIPDYKYYNIRALFLLLEKKFVMPDKSFIDDYFERKPYYKYYANDTFQYFYYMYPVIKEYINETSQKNIEKNISQKYDEDISIFKEKCKIGENDSYICSLIREDSVEEFISYVNRINLPLCSKIEPSFYETNSFLIDKEPTLIEYAAFFGSIQIIQYLKYNQVPLTPSLWLYAIHSNNADLIHFLEENEVEAEAEQNKPKTKKTHGWFYYDNYESTTQKESFDDVIKESIKCHHNNIANYIKDNLLKQTQIDDLNQFSDIYCLTIKDSLNFFFYPDDDIKTLICKPRNEKGFNISCIMSSLTNIIIPSSVTSIGDYAFSDCSSLIQITISPSVTSIGDYAFSECVSLMHITIPSSVTSIGDYAFSECVSLTQISIPSSVTSIGDYAFSECTALTGIEISSSLASINDYTFNRCSKLAQIAIPSSVTSIGDCAFSGCSSLEQITIPSSVTSIGKSAFIDCLSLTEISISSSLTSISDELFSGCSSLTQIVIPSSVTSIGNSAFLRCSKLNQITIPFSPISIGCYAFYGCLSLTKIVIPSSVTSIGKSAFYECLSLQQIIIPYSEIGVYVATNRDALKIPIFTNIIINQK